MKATQNEEKTLDGEEKKTRLSQCAFRTTAFEQAGLYKNGAWLALGKEKVWNC